MDLSGQVTFTGQLTLTPQVISDDLDNATGNKMNLLEKVKIGLLITGDFHDAVLTQLIAEVKQYMLDAGVSSETVDSDKAVGVIVRGVSDMFGTVVDDYSTIFKNRVTQLSLGDKCGV